MNEQLKSIKITQNIIRKYRSADKTILQAQISMLITVTLLSLSFFGCGTMFVREGKYTTPDLPQSELATIQVDTNGKWIQKTNLISLRINGKLALRQEIREDKTISIDEILVAPGKHHMLLIVLTDSFPEGIRQDRQTMSYYSIETKADNTYLLKGKFSDSNGDDLTFELVDTETDKVVSKMKVLGKSIVKLQTTGETSFEHKLR